MRVLDTPLCKNKYALLANIVADSGENSVMPPALAKIQAVGDTDMTKSERKSKRALPPSSPDYRAKRMRTHTCTPPPSTPECTGVGCNTKCALHTHTHTRTHEHSAECRHLCVLDTVRVHVLRVGTIPQLEVHLGHVRAVASKDTGAGLSCIDAAYFSTLEQKGVPVSLRSTTRKVTSANNSPLTCLGIATIPMVVGKLSITHEFLVI